ncbi:hypothetical protein LXA43DRAFT_1078788 [Ganoderma leucocontextum]|nr:hypothetical protein LXA43DRAFT_1078788 [Ganoderma leucocontextum]
MVDTRFARVTTPARARNGPTQGIYPPRKISCIRFGGYTKFTMNGLIYLVSAVPQLRASSVPAEASKKPEWPLDCLSASPRKRKRTSVHEDSLSKPTPQSQGTRRPRTPHREVKRAPAHAAEPRVRGMSFADREIVATGLAASLRANSRTRSATRSSSLDGRPRRGCASTSRAQSEMPSERPPHVLAQPRRAHSRARRNDHGSAKPPPRTVATGAPLTAAASRRTKPSGTSRGRAKEKGKVRALPEDVSMDEPWDADESSVSGRRNVKRRRLSPPPSLSPDGEDGSQETAVEEDFEMLDGPQSLPWVPVDPGSKHSEYVPPGLNALIDDMKRALVLQISARQKAENMHAEELQRRLDLEQEAARLATVNRALEAERSAWTVRAAAVATAGIRATRLESPPLSDLSPPQLAVNTDAPAAEDLPRLELGMSGFEEPSGHTADVEMAEATRTVSANHAVGARAEHGNGSPSGMHVHRGSTATVTATVV